MMRKYQLPLSHAYVRQFVYAMSFHLLARDEDDDNAQREHIFMNSHDVFCL